MLVHAHVQGVLVPAQVAADKMLKSGFYHYERKLPGGLSKIHLRLNSDGNGTLFVNANKVIHLNATATLMAKMILEEKPEQITIHTLQSQFRVNKKQARNDYAQFRDQFFEYISPDGACPIHELPSEIIAPFSIKPSAPYRMDLALTYRCNNECSHCYNARPRKYPELPTNNWIDILDELYKIGIPHVVFTGGEPTVYDGLCELIAYSNKIGLITGLNTNGRMLSDAQYLEKLIDAGLDHVQITIESHDPAIHDEMVRAKGAWLQTISGLRNALKSPLFVMTNTTMLKPNSPCLEDTLRFLADLGVPTLGLNAMIYSGKGKTARTSLNESELSPLLDLAKEITQIKHQRLIWYTPTQYCHFDPMQLELGVKGCTAALYNMCIEPDGCVIPCQSYYQTIGNILSNSWESIWNHDLAIFLRERKYIQPECISCALISECGGGCPLAIDWRANVTN